MSSDKKQTDKCEAMLSQFQTIHNAMFPHIFKAFNDFADRLCNECEIDNCDKCPLWWNDDPTNSEQVMLFDD